MNALLRSDLDALRGVCRQNSQLPTAALTLTALDRLGAKDQRLRASWRDALERRRQVLNQELRQNLWLLGTIGSAAPFIGLFGTVVGILRSFQEMARTGSGGFAVVAAGISESLVATAAGIVVAVVAVMSFNAFQTRWSYLVLTVRLQMEELVELLDWVVQTSGPSDGA
jgi:biopolymer transport protein ExbB